MTSLEDHSPDRAFDARAELLAALERAYDRCSDGRLQREHDTDLSGRGEDFWAEYGTMMYECQSGIEIAESHPREHDESWPAWLARIRRIYREKHLHEALNALDSISYRTYVAHCRSLQLEEVVAIATSFAPCDEHDAAIDTMDDESILLSVVRDAGCTGAKRHAAQRLALLFPERKAEFEARIPVCEKMTTTFAERAAASAQQEDRSPIELPAGVTADELVAKALNEAEEAAQKARTRETGRRGWGIGSRLVNIVNRVMGR